MKGGLNAEMVAYELMSMYADRLCLSLQTCHECHNIGGDMDFLRFIYSLLGYLKLGISKEQQN